MFGRAAGEQAPWYFLHIPKTAGTSLLSLLPKTGRLCPARDWPQLCARPAEERFAGYAGHFGGRWPTIWALRCAPSRFFALRSSRRFRDTPRSFALSRRPTASCATRRPADQIHSPRLLMKPVPWIAVRIGAQPGQV